MVRRVLIGAMASLLMTGLISLADTAPVVPTNSPDAIKNDLIIKQEQLARQFREFTSSLLRLAQRLERSEKLDDRERAKALRRAIELAEKEGVDNQFSKLIGILTKSNSVSLTELQQAAGQNEQLIKGLREILAILLTDDEAARIRAEILKTQELLKEVQGVIRETKINRAVTESGRGDNKKVAKDQNNIANKTAEIAKKMGGEGKRDNQGKDLQTAKAESKGEGKEANGKQADPKPDTGDPKGQEKEPMNGKSPMPGDPMGGEGKKGPPKEGEPMMGGEGKKGPPMGGDPKESKGGEPKKGPMGEPMPMNGNPMPMPMNPMSGEPKQGQPSESKSQGQGKGEPKSGKGEAKGQAKGQASPGQPMPPMQASGQGEPKSGGQPGKSPPQQANNQPQPPKPDMPGRRQVEDAIPNQDNATDKIEKDNRDDASKQQDQAIEKLTRAQQELEKRLKQLREEELERLLANLEGRCNAMLAMQIEVYEGTKQVHGSIQKNTPMEATRNDAQKSLQLADREGKIVDEADKAIKLLEGEGSAVAFPQVFMEVKRDMIAVQRRLAAVRVDEDTQSIEEDIIATLKEMIAALKKAQQDLKKDPPPPGQPGAPPPNQPKSLIDQLAELKMIRNLQVRVNERTTKYAGKYQGEQADDPIIRNELKDLSDRQDRVRSMLQDIATGKNQ